MSVKPPKHPEQIGVIHSFIKQAGMRDWKELAKAAGIKDSTMSKLIGGHQPLTASKRQQMEMAVKIRHLSGDASNLDLPPGATLREEPTGYRTLTIDLTILPDERLNDLQDFLTKESRRPDLDKDGRTRFLKSLNAIVTEQERRTVNCAPLGEDEETGLANAGAAKRLAQESSLKQKAAAPSADKHGRGGGAAAHSK